MPFEVDILEDSISRLSPELLNTLLKDHTTSKEDVQHNIFWATSDYENLGEGYKYDNPILPELITGNNGHVIMPRVLKSRSTQTARSRDMAEVFTPSWICNAQNNLIDEAWFERKDVFNTEYTDEQGCHRWKTTEGNIVFPENKAWKDYIKYTCLEITCGEAPYLVSRYDATTGDAIQIENRIGLLDRKLRIVSENTKTSGEWLKWAQIAFQNVYGYEWQGDNLLIARENL
ncbi:MAG: restriction endonuclease subunit M, partial [Bacteroidaceae bacterium]